MANFCGVTVCDGIKVTKKQRAALDKILAKYHFAMEDIQLGQEDEFWICGYDWLNIVGMVPVEKGMPDEGKLEPDPNDEDVSEDFFEDIRKILVKGQQLVITCVGNEKLRYASGMKVTVTPEKVEWVHI